MKDRQPLLTPEDCVLAEDIAKADAEVAAMVKEAYGITDLSLLACDPWSGVPACPPLPEHAHTPAHARCQGELRQLTALWKGIFCMSSSGRVLHMLMGALGERLSVC